jgi:outer membrane immunogenic protein
LPGLSASTKIDSLASVTGRVGYSWGRVLGYVKGGGAWVKNEYSLQATLITPFNGTQTIGSLTNTRGGWTVGVGGEYAFLDSRPGPARPRSSIRIWDWVQVREDLLP